MLHCNSAAIDAIEGIHDDPTMTMTADSADYLGIFTGEVDGMAAFMQGKLKLAGDLNLAMKLTQMFKISWLETSKSGNQETRKPVNPESSNQGEGIRKWKETLSRWERLFLFKRNARFLLISEQMSNR